MSFLPRAGLAIGLTLLSASLLAQSNPAKSIGAVHAVGCLVKDGDKWLLTKATEPVPTQISPLTKEESDAADAIERLGEGVLHLIGVEAFDLPGQDGNKVQVKGLLIEAEPLDRLNVTSVRSMAPKCPE